MNWNEHIFFCRISLAALEFRSTLAIADTSVFLFCKQKQGECHGLEWVAGKIIFSLCIVCWHSKVSRLFGHNIMHVIRRWSRKEFCALKLNEPLRLGTHTENMIVHIIEGDRRVASIRYAIVNMIFFCLMVLVLRTVVAK